MHGYCSMCGKCCEAIRLTVPKDEIHKHAESILRRWTRARRPDKMVNEADNDWIFVDQHWHPMTEVEAFAVNPMHEYWSIMHPEYNGHLYYFTCDMYDPATHKCTAHDERPRICRDYPYSRFGNLDETLWYSPTCGYIDEADPTVKTSMIDLALELEKVPT